VYVANGVGEYLYKTVCRLKITGCIGKYVLPCLRPELERTLHGNKCSCAQAVITVAALFISYGYCY